MVSPSPVVCLENIVEESNTSSGSSDDLTEQETLGENEILKEPQSNFDLPNTATTAEIMDEAD